MSQLLNIIYIYLYTYVINGNICYLSSSTYIMKCTGFVLGWRLSTECVIVQPLHLYLFPLGVKVLATTR